MLLFHTANNEVSIFSRDHFAKGFTHFHDKVVKPSMSVILSLSKVLPLEIKKAGVKVSIPVCYDAGVFLRPPCLSAAQWPTLSPLIVSSSRAVD